MSVGVRGVSMNKFIAILRDSFYEIKAQKILWMYGLTGLFMALMILVLPTININGQDMFQSGSFSPEMIDQVSAFAFDKYFFFMIIFMIFGSVGMIPSFLKKGRVELSLSKPMSRVGLLSMKFASIYLIKISILIIISIFLWLAMSVRLGSFSYQFFNGLLFSLVEYFAVYSILFFLGVATRSGPTALILYYVIRMLAVLVSTAGLVADMVDQTAWYKFINILYHILPKLGAVSDNYEPLMLGKGLSDFYAVWSTLIVAVVLFSSALFIHQRRDY